jgi:glycosyltransferase involved in cell wall biosynthesis
VAPRSPSQPSVLAGKRILLIHARLELGGAERQALHLARYLIREHGARVEMWGFESAGDLARLCDEYGVPWRIVPLGWVPSKMEKLLGLARFALVLRRARPDILLPYTVLPNTVCGLVWRWTSARLSVWNQRAVVEWSPTKLQQWAAARTRFFISNSQHGAEYLTHKFGLNPGTVNVVRNGVELGVPQADRASWRERLGLTSAALVACMVATLSEYKDHETLIRAWSQVVDAMRGRGETPVLLLAGRFGQTQLALKALAFDLDLGRNVRFLGHVDDIAGLLGAVDLGVFSSRSEGSPNGVLECMAAGLPVVGTDEPGIREVIGPDGYPCLAPPGDADALSARVLRLIDDPLTRTRLGSLNRARIEAEFSMRAMCERTASLMANALSS